MKQIEQVTLRNGVKLYPFSSNEELIDFVSNEKKILVVWYYLVKFLLMVKFSNI